MRPSLILVIVILAVIACESATPRAPSAPESGESEEQPRAVAEEEMSQAVARDEGTAPVLSVLPLPVRTGVEPRKPTTLSLLEAGEQSRHPRPAR